MPERQSNDDARYVLQLVKILRSYRLGEYDGASSPTLTVMVSGGLGFDDLRFSDENKFIEMAGDAQTREATAIRIKEQIREHCIAKGGEIQRDSREMNEVDDIGDNGELVTVGEELDVLILSVDCPTYEVLWEVIGFINENFTEYGVFVDVPSADNDCQVQLFIPAALDGETMNSIQAHIRKAMGKAETVLVRSEGSNKGFIHEYLFLHESEIFGVADELRKLWDGEQLGINGSSVQVQYANNMELMKLAAEIRKSPDTEAEQVEKWEQETGRTRQDFFEMLQLAHDCGLELY